MRLSGFYLLGSSAVGSLCILQFGYDQSLPFWVFPSLVMVTRFGVSAVFSIIYIANSNYFPTLFSTTAMGLSNFIARMACIMAPQVAEFENKQFAIQILGALLVVGTASVMMLPEDQKASKPKVKSE